MKMTKKLPGFVIRRCMTTTESKWPLDLSMDLSGDYQRRILTDGFAIVEDVVPTRDVFELRASIASMPEGDEVRRKANVYGVRNLLEVNDDVRRLAASSQIRSLVVPILGVDCFAVRATFFDKVPDANWNLRFHQDGVISVKERCETPGFSSWSNKAGTLQVRPPEYVLQRMLSIRIHLDDCPQENGALRVLVGSHRRQWQREQIPDCKSEFDQVVCEVDKGGVLAMRPLILHASSASIVPEHRRVIHIEFAADDLPDGLDWNQRVGIG